MRHDWVKKVIAMVRGIRKPKQTTVSSVILDEYVDAFPSPQNAIDLIAGWNHALPPTAGVVTGSTIPMFADSRIDWCVEQFGGITSCRVLELGPLEGAHTYMLHQQRPALIHSIEANKLSFMRCLIVKQLLSLDRATFMLGDFRKWLDQSSERYDLIVGSGVLYHMPEPIRLLELMSQRTDALYIWTHYFSEQAMPPGDPRRGAFSGDVKVIKYAGLPFRLHKRSYHQAWRNKSFCGGMQDEHYWMEREQILHIINLLGFDDVRIGHDTPDHPNGPSLSIFARRTNLSPLSHGIVL
jgi:Methyltransferase domain